MGSAGELRQGPDSGGAFVNWRAHGQRAGARRVGVPERLTSRAGIARRRTRTVQAMVRGGSRVGEGAGGGGPGEQVVGGDGTAQPSRVGREVPDETCWSPASSLRSQMASQASVRFCSLRPSARPRLGETWPSDPMIRPAAPRASGAAPPGAQNRRPTPVLFGQAAAPPPRTRQRPRHIVGEHVAPLADAATSCRSLCTLTGTYPISYFSCRGRRVARVVG